MVALNKYLKLLKPEKLSESRVNEILAYLLETDAGYQKLTEKRAQSSMMLKNTIAGSKEADILFEEYSDAVYAQESYELEIVYKQGFIDAVADLYDKGLLN
jgi:hypothetical protein